MTRSPPWRTARSPSASVGLVGTRRGRARGAARRSSRAAGAGPPRRGPARAGPARPAAGRRGAGASMGRQDAPRFGRTALGRWPTESFNETKHVRPVEGKGSHEVLGIRPRSRPDRRGAARGPGNVRRRTRTARGGGRDGEERADLGGARVHARAAGADGGDRRGRRGELPRAGPGVHGEHDRERAVHRLRARRASPASRCSTTSSRCWPSCSAPRSARGSPARGRRTRPAAPLLDGRPARGRGRDVRAGRGVVRRRAASARP